MNIGKQLQLLGCVIIEFLALGSDHVSVNGWHFVGLYTKVYTLNSQQQKTHREWMRSLANWFDYEILWATTVIAVKYTYSSYWCDFCVQHTSVRVRVYYVKNNLKLPFCEMTKTKWAIV